MIDDRLHDIIDVMVVDYLFLGMGAANSLLFLQMHKQNLLNNKSIAIIEPNFSSLKEKTFCFWANEAELILLGLEQLINNSWNNIQINNYEKQSIKPLNYYHIPGENLYDATETIIQNYPIQFFKEALTKSPEFINGVYTASTHQKTITANKIFDSRTPTFLAPKKNQTNLLQTFKGWKIKTNQNHFDTSTAVFMDFNIPQQNACQFIYVLPYSKDYALVEVTKFGTTKLQDAEADLLLKDYLSKKEITYSIIEEERGCLPMSSSTIYAPTLGDNWINTGSRGNLLKPSSGYAFRTMAKDAVAISNSLINNKTYKRKSKHIRFKFYDRLLLKIIEQKPAVGKLIFETLFKKVSTQKVMIFLNEETSLADEANIFKKLPIAIFVHTALNDFKIRIQQTKPVFLALFFTIIAIGLTWLQLNYITIGLLATLFLSIGLSHGAIDHLTDNAVKSTKDLPKFISTYLLKGALLGGLWLLQPDMALVGFILFSAWHFGQTDFKEWQITNKLHSFAWGFSILALILLLHFNETVNVLQYIPGLKTLKTIQLINSSQLLYPQIFITMVAIILSWFHKSIAMMVTIFTILLSYFLPLLESFGIYFVFQHSLHGWKHLKTYLQLSTSKMLLKAAPYTVMAIIIIALFMLNYKANYLGIFFILLSCISMPHVISMHNFYKRK